MRVSIAFRGTRLRVVLRVVVRDDGGGMHPARDPAHATAHFGLVGMRERVASIGAELRRSSAPGRGTSVRLDVSLAEEKLTQAALRLPHD